MRSSLLCTQSILTHSSACHCTPMAQLKAWCDEPNGEWLVLCNQNRSSPLWKDLNLKSIKPKNPVETLLGFGRPSPSHAKILPLSWMSAEVALRTTDHDRPLSCFGFCFHHLQARCGGPGYRDLIFLVQGGELSTGPRTVRPCSLVYVCLWKRSCSHQR